MSTVSFPESLGTNYNDCYLISWIGLNRIEKQWEIQLQSICPTEFCLCTSYSLFYIQKSPIGMQLSDNESGMFQNAWGAAKQVRRGRFIFLNAFIRNKIILKISEPSC